MLPQFLQRSLPEGKQHLGLLDPWMLVKYQSTALPETTKLTSLIQKYMHL